MLEYPVQRNKGKHDPGMKTGAVSILFKAVMAALAANENLGQLVGTARSSSEASGWYVVSIEVLISTRTWPFVNGTTVSG
jgi:hypothetical protein